MPPRPGHEAERLRRPRFGEESIEKARRRATPTVVDVRKRYPLAPRSTNRVRALMSMLDSLLRRP
jgi:hypothetical protein